ncbi:hypothetical protein BDV93DRAFT_399593, partial [Ceratobasidium sp. AG-I]
GNVKAPGSSVTYSHKNFANIPHCDFDVSPWTFGIWGTVIQDGSLINDDQKEATAISGGQFFWADYGIAADFGKNPGITLLLWRGNTDRHAT